MNRKVALGLAAGCLLICGLGALITLVGGGAFLRWALQEPEDVRITVTTPSQVTHGSDFILEVTVENTATVPQTLDSVDITLSYLEGVAVNRTQPPYTDAYLIPLVDYQSHTFAQEIAPGGRLTVQFFMSAVQSGDFNGEVDVCINSGSICHTSLIRTVIGGG